MGGFESNARPATGGATGGATGAVPGGAPPIPPPAPAGGFRALGHHDGLGPVGGPGGVDLSGPGAPFGTGPDLSPSPAAPPVATFSREQNDNLPGPRVAAPRVSGLAPGLGHGANRPLGHGLLGGGEGSKPAPRPLAFKPDPLAGHTVNAAGRAEHQTWARLLSETKDLRGALPVLNRAVKEYGLQGQGDVGDVLGHLNALAPKSAQAVQDGIFQGTGIRVQPRIAPDGPGFDPESVRPALPKANPWGSADGADPQAAAGMAKVLLTKGDYAQGAVPHFKGEFARDSEAARAYTAAVYDAMAKSDPQAAALFARQMGDGGLVPDAPHSVEAPLAGQGPGTPLPPHIPVSRPEKTAWDKIRSAAGPHVAGAVERAGEAVKWGLDWLSPGADIKDAVEQSGDAAEAAKRGDWTGAARDTAGAALSLGGVLIPGTVKGIKEGAEAATKTAGDAIRRGLPDVSRTENPISAKEFAQLPDTGTIDPKRVRTMQMGVSGRFGDRHSLEETIEGLRKGNVKPEHIPPIRVGEFEGEIYTMDHRRLIAFREAGMPIRYEKVAPETMKKAAKNKMDTRDSGITLKIRKGQKNDR